MVLRRPLAWLWFHLMERAHRKVLEQSTYRPDQRQVEQARQRLKRILTENIIPFWYPRVMDHDAGGYRVNHDIEGRWKGPAPRDIVTQARLVWYFSRLFRSPYGMPEHLDAARHGYEFLRDRLWDKEYGGFCWQVDASGTAVTVSEKHLYGQGFGLYALTEYARVSGDSEAIGLASDLFAVLEQHAHDATHGGYRESFSRDWQPTTQRSNSFFKSTPAGLKSVNAHLHLLEPLIDYYDRTKDVQAYRRLVELVVVNCTTVLNLQTGAGGIHFARDWTPVRIFNHERAVYGHDLERVWLLHEGCKVAGLSTSLLRESCRRSVDNVLAHGIDRRNGGVYESGPFMFRPGGRDKVWWVQAESLLGALYFFLVAGRRAYWDFFVQTLTWIDEHQVDWQRGGWYLRVKPDGTPVGDKAMPWKDAYHEGRATLMALDLLSTLSPGPSR